MGNFKWIEEFDEIALVAVVPGLKDWEILKKEHWYRIPVDKAPKIIDKVKYLAFYQPKVFGEEKWSVNYYSRIKDREIKKRIELLPDEPKHPRAQKEYYKFNLEGIKKLPHSIPSRKWRRIVFIPTTMEKLFKAKEINDLYHTSPIEEKLYNLMKKNGLSPERQVFVREVKKRYALDFAVYCQDGKINIECDGKKIHSGELAHNQDRERNNDLASLGWIVLRFTGREIITTPHFCLKTLKKAIRQLGNEI